MRGPRRHCALIAEALERHPRVSRVNYPGLPSHPQHALARAQMAVFSGMISFQVAGDGPALAARMGRQLGLVHHAVSLGHTRSLICWMGTEGMLATSFRLTGAAAKTYRDWAGAGLFRLSVGLKDAEDILRDLDRVL